MDSKNSAFFDACKQLENTIKNRFGSGGRDMPYEHLSRQRGFRQYDGDLDLIRQLRNMLAHNGGFDGEDAFVVSDAAMAKILEILHKLDSPRRAGDIMSADLVSASLSDSPAKAMERMKQSGHGYIPILSGGRVVGVFSENSIVRYLKEHSSMEIDYRTPLHQLQRYTDLDTNPNESFGFVGRDADEGELQDQFELRDRDGKRVAALFVTEDGNQTGDVLGIITPWDLMRQRHND